MVLFTRDLESYHIFYMLNFLRSLVFYSKNSIYPELSDLPVCEVPS